MALLPAIPEVATGGGAPRGRAAELWSSAQPIELFARRLSDGLLAGRYRSLFRGSGQEVEELREYVEGDDPRTIDAGVTARLGRPFVKRFLDERHTTLVFVLDRSASMASGAGAAPWDAALLTLAALARAAGEHQDRVGLVLLGASGAAAIPPSGGRRAGRRLLEAALAAPADQRGVDWEAGLVRARALLPGRGTLLLLSDFLEGLPGLAGERQSGPLVALARERDVIAARFVPGEHLVWPVANGGPSLRVRDPEGGPERLLSPAAGAAFVAALAQRRERFARAARRAGLDLFDVPLDTDQGAAGLPSAIARALLGLDASRRARGRRR
jgi:uncharacterized protein (DUF58 family)